MLYKDFFRFLENKDRLIDKLDLTDEQKDQLKSYFKKYPTSESKIDWNRKDLKWEDFSDLFASEGKSKSQAKKKGISGLKEGIDYLYLGHEDGEYGKYTVYYPMTFLASETLANPKVEPLGVTGKWCIAGGNYGPGNEDKYWRQYTEEKNYDFFFIFTDKHKYAIARKINSDSWFHQGGYDIFTDKDQEISSDQLVKELLFDAGIWKVGDSKPDNLYDMVNNTWGYLRTRYLQNEEARKKFFPIKSDIKFGEGIADIKTSADGTALLKMGIHTGTGKIVLPEELKTLRSESITGDNAEVVIKSKHKLVTYAGDGNSDNIDSPFTHFGGTVYTNQLPANLFHNAGKWGSFVSADNQSFRCHVQADPDITEIGDNCFTSYVYWGPECKEVNTGDEDQPIWDRVYEFKDLFSGDIPQNLTYVGTGAFQSSTIWSFPFEKYPDCNYASYAFSGSLLHEAKLPEGIKTLRYNLFAWCRALKDIWIPKSVNRIEAQALFNLHKDVVIHYAGSEEDWAEIDLNPAWMGYIRFEKGIKIIFQGPDGPKTKYYNSIGQEEEEPYQANTSGYAGW